MLALQHGMAFSSARPLLPADIVSRLAELAAPRILITTPIHLRSLLSHTESIPSLECIVCATAPLSPELAKMAEVRFGAPLFEIYGCTEVGQIAWRRTVETSAWTCLDDIELRECNGWVTAEGPAAASAEPLNDVIELIDHKHFLLHGRKSDLINIAGKRSSLSHLNFQLNAIAGVDDGVFIAPADSEGVTRLTAYVVAPQLKPDDILNALRRVIDPVFLPRPLFLVDALPRNAVGKLTKDSLLQLKYALGGR
jgi:acyl-coenzyme A synthetase/AMP-(fatty) acid ligase